MCRHQVDPIRCRRRLLLRRRRLLRRLRSCAKYTHNMCKKSMRDGRLLVPVKCRHLVVSSRIYGVDLLDSTNAIHKRLTLSCN